MVKNREFFMIKEMHLKGMYVTHIAEELGRVRRRYENGWSKMSLSVINVKTKEWVSWMHIKTMYVSGWKRVA